MGWWIDSRKEGVWDCTNSLERRWNEKSGGKILCTLGKGVGALKRWAVDSLIIMLILYYQEHDWSRTHYIFAIL